MVGTREAGDRARRRSGRPELLRSKKRLLKEAVYYLGEMHSLMLQLRDLKEEQLHGTRSAEPPPADAGFTLDKLGDEKNWCQCSDCAGSYVTAETLKEMFDEAKLRDIKPSPATTESHVCACCDDGSCGCVGNCENGCEGDCFVDESRDDYPIAVFEDRYGGVYSGGKWIAVAKCDADATSHGNSRFQFAFDGTHGDDMRASEFGSIIESTDWMAVGNTPDEAIANLHADISDCAFCAPCRCDDECGCVPGPCAICNHTGKSPFWPTMERCPKCNAIMKGGKCLNRISCDYEPRISADTAERANASEARPSSPSLPQTGDEPGLWCPRCRIRLYHSKPHIHTPAPDPK